MPLVINTNVAALNAQRQLVKSGSDMAQAMERLASGKRVNTARDDAAGLAISNRQTSQIRGLDQAIRNANDGVSLIQTAEGALDEVTNILQRIRELSIQSANGIYSDLDRSTLDAEAQQLKQEVDRIAQSTTFNGQPLLDGSLSDVALQVGSEAYQTIDLEIQGFSTSSLGGTSGDIVGEVTLAGLDSLTAFDGTATNSITVNDITLSTLAGITAAGSTVNDALAIINADLDGKGAEASTLISVEADAAGSGVLAGTDTVDIVLTDADGNAQSYILSGTSNLSELAEMINSDTIIDAKINDEGKLILSAENSESVNITDASGATGLGAGQLATDIFFALVFTDTSSESNGVNFLTDAATADVQALGINTQDTEGNIIGVAGIGETNTIQKGDLKINGVDVPSFTGVAAAAATIDTAIVAINSISEQTGVVAYAETATTIGMRSTKGNEISIQYGGGATAQDVLDATGLLERNALSGSGSVAGIAIDTAEGAQQAIDVIDVALEQINSTRSELGAINNRLDFTMSNLANVSEKTSAARSRIIDADFASETSQLSRAQVLQQASQAMLAQANAQPQQVLQLLQG
ncbi:flagellin N-terminal helical domain-containing protein [Teredinibacter franksiae]|jgi:Flagellin and related hook-associated proteins|uniref:flagellin N-terminal helical domain-containing protein n=1 Tax=Teredinibacter franksiae TaxID=2761453 RepID=UPI00162AF11D|nr:flagellin [Teredinibacter franksiae]